MNDEIAQSREERARFTPPGYTRREDLLHIEQLVHGVSQIVGPHHYCVPSIAMPEAWRCLWGPAGSVPYEGWVLVDMRAAIKPFGKLPLELPPLRVEQRLGASFELIAGMCSSPLRCVFKNGWLLGLLDEVINNRKAAAQAASGHVKRIAEEKLARLTAIMRSVYAAPIRDWERYATDLEEMWLWRRGD